MKKRKIAISAESTIDLPKELLNEYEIHTIPFTVLLGDRSGYDGDITPTEIFNFVDENKILPKTSAVNEFEYNEYFEKLLKEYDGIVHISLSSEISSAYAHAEKTSRLFKNVFVIDSRTLSSGIALLAIYATQLADNDESAQKIAEKVQARVPSVQASFVINTLNYLHKSGRCSSLAMISATLLRIKPQIIVKHGSLISGKKYRGKNSQVISEYCDDILAEFCTPDLSVGFITHTQASEEMVQSAIEKMKQMGFKKIYTTIAGATISSHCGPKTLGILYLNDGNIKRN